MMKKPSFFSLLHQIVRMGNGFSEWTGRWVAWLVLTMVLVIVYDVSMRSLFSIGSVLLQELQWHLFALIFLLGAAYTFKHDGHVRVDVFYQSRYMTDRKRAWVNIWGGLLLLIPYCLLIIISAWPFVYSSYQFSEGSPDPGGLPYRFILKGAIVFGFGLLLLQGIINILENFLQLFDKSNQEHS
ncbi:TRAP transporter small permease subunit [Thioflexithrix psekupsensis]|uniref:TRAP transporter small permease protein n=1 Tax=Thioflexithrix psekupsensis TaxID=1570016 RepID=A0A251X7J8_9GAMM|nr:TRAP transporter small permease subunit [Thioflexithrix psekupsensis]OUD14038.1 C4-dicarboxylate ABC transporter permease [Thioflexithrix psekupsensis]